MIDKWKFKSLFKNWFAKRMPLSDVVILNQKSSYIWPTRSGFLLLGILILMLIGATNYQNNLAFSLTFLMVGIGLVTIVYTFKNLQGIQFSKVAKGELFVGHSKGISVALKSITGKPHSGIAIGFESSNSVWCDVPAKENELVDLAFTPKMRGYQKLPRIKVRSVFPFGWLSTWSYFKFESPVLVFAQPIEPPVQRNDIGDDSAEQGSQKIGNEEFYGLKSYQAGESLSRIDWKSFARERGLFVKEFVSYQGEQLCFNWADFAGFSDERKISYLTYLVIQAAQENIGYSLKLPNQFFGFDDSESHRVKCLTALALYQLSRFGAENISAAISQPSNTENAKEKGVS